MNRSGVQASTESKRSITTGVYLSVAFSYIQMSPALLVVVLGPCFLKRR